MLGTIAFATAPQRFTQVKMVQVLFRPTYLGVFLGLPTQELHERLGVWAEKLWGNRGNLHIEMGKPQDNLFAPLAVLVELASDKLLEGANKWDAYSCAYLVFLCSSDGIEDGVSRFVQRLVDRSNLRWQNVAVNASP